MALADLVLEGLTLILVIALGLVLIGSLAYLTMTVTSANNARLAYAGLYVYLPQPFYVNGTLYVPMLNIGYYKALVRYVYVRAVDGSVHVYAPGLVLGLGQYYVYRVSLGYEPVAVTVVASPVGYPGVVREFSANVTGVSSVPVVTLSGPGTGGGLIEVIVNDPYGAGWRVTWSYAGQTYSMSQSQSYTWYINPPYAPIQISFQASITQNPSANGINYTCQVNPSQVSGSYGPGSVITFNVECGAEYYVVVQLYAPCNNWYGVSAWTDTQSVSVGGYSTQHTFTLYYTSNDPNGLGWVDFQAYADADAWLGGSLTVYNESAPGSPVVNKTSSWYNVGGIGGEEYSQVLTIDTLPGMVYKAVYSSPGCASSAPIGGGNNQISVTVSDPYGAGWSITWSGGASGSKSGSSTDSWTISAGSTVNFNAKITSVPSGYNSCTITPQTTSANPGGSVTFTVSCTSNNTGPQPPQPVAYGCFLTTSATSNPSGIPVSVNPSGTTFLGPGQSIWVYFNAPTSQTISSSSSSSYWYEFIDWVLTANPVSDTNLGSSPFQTSDPSPEVYVKCPSNLNSNITISVGGTAYYQEDYYTVSGPTSISSGGSYTYTVSWSLAPFSAYEEDWSLSTQYQSQTAGYINVQVIIKAKNAGGAQIAPSPTWQTYASCSAGTLILSVSPTSATTYNSGTSGTASVTATITYSCSTGRNGAG